MNGNKVLRKTESMCPICMARLPAEIISSKSKIFLERNCPDHGKIQTYLAVEDDYDQFIHFYRILQRKNLKSYGISIQLTTRCNLSCPVCFVHTHKHNPYEEPTIDQIKEIIKDINDDDITLTGGEPTLREDLPQIMMMISRTTNRPMLVTNGIRISDLKYLRVLKKSGLSSVRLSYDGFNDTAYLKLSGKKLIHIKQKALKNLQTLRIPTVIEFTLTKGVNDKDIGRLYDLIEEHDVITGVGIRSYLHLGAAGLSKDDSSSVFEIARNLDSSPLSNYRDIMTFMKFYMLVSYYFNINNCPYLWYYILIRDRKENVSDRQSYSKRSHNSLVSFNKVFSLKKAGKAIDQNIRLISEGKKPLLHFLFAVLPSIINSRSVKILYQVGFSFIRKLLGYPLNVGKFPSSFIFLMIEGACDLNYYDKDFQNCTGRDYCPQKGIITILQDNINREAILKKSS